MGPSDFQLRSHRVCDGVDRANSGLETDRASASSSRLDLAIDPSDRYLGIPDEPTDPHY